MKGYEYEKDRYVVLTDDDFDAVPVESSRAIDIVQFVELDEIDPILFKKSYYLVPEETGAKAYALLREAMSEDDRVGIAKVSFRDKEHLAALRFKDDAFVLETMFWPDEIREADFGGVDVDTEGARPGARDGAPADRHAHRRMGPRGSSHDEYREALLQIVEAKLNGEEIEVVEPEPSRQGRRPDGGPEGERRRREEGRRGRQARREDVGQEEGGRQEARGEEASRPQESGR